MPSSTLPALKAPVPADLARARDKIPWIDDEDLREIEHRSVAGATALGLFTWGGGHLMAGEHAKGAGLIVALIGWVSLAGATLPDPVGSLVYLAVGAVNAVFAYRKVRARNRFVSLRHELSRADGPGPHAYRLLSAAAAVDPTAAQELARARAAGVLPPRPPPPAPAGPTVATPLLDKLRKLAALRAAGVINETEHKDRKIDLLTAAAPATRGELDDLLFELLPLADEGVLLPEDFEFLKQVGA